MKIIAIEHKFEPDQRVETYLSKVEAAIAYKPDIIVGPDYGITSFNSDGTVDFGSQNQVRDQLAKLSLESPQTLMIPGTWPVLMGYSKMGHSAPIFRNGENFRNFLKQTDVENSGIAAQNNLIFQRGNYDENSLIHQGKKIAVEICSDHGKQPVDKDTFLEVILARDLRAGFYAGAANDDFSRYAIVNDSENPKIEGIKYSHNTHPRMAFASEQELNSFLTQFTLQ